MAEPRVLLCGLVLSLAALLAGCEQPRASADEAPIVLRYGSPYSPLHPFSRADQTWIAHVEKASGGRLRIEPHWSGALLSADQSLLELRHGVADLGVITPIYARGGAHALRAQAGFYAGARTFESQVGVYQCLAREFAVFGRELTGLRVLAVQGGNLPGIVTRERPVHGVDDLAGLRLRAPAELLEVLRALGADPVNMPMGEVYSALAKGILDGVVAPADALRALHLAEVGRHFATLAIPRGGYPSRAIAERTYARLPAALQTVLRESQPVWERALSKELARALAGGLAYGREQGVTFASWSAPEQQRFDAAYNEAARASAAHLRDRGVDGPQMFARAQQWSALLASRDDVTAPLPCP